MRVQVHSKLEKLRGSVPRAGRAPTVFVCSKRSFHHQNLTQVKSLTLHNPAPWSLGWFLVCWPLSSRALHDHCFLLNESYCCQPKLLGSAPSQSPLQTPSLASRWKPLESPEIQKTIFCERSNFCESSLSLQQSCLVGLCMFHLSGDPPGVALSDALMPTFEPTADDACAVYQCPGCASTECLSPVRSLQTQINALRNRVNTIKARD